MIKKYSFPSLIAFIDALIITIIVGLFFKTEKLSSLTFYLYIFLISFFTICITILAATRSMRKKIRHLYYNVFNLKRYKETSIAHYIDEISKQVTQSSQQKMQEIDVLIERESYRREFLGNVSHELKTPLFSIQGFLLTLIEGGIEDKKIRYKYLERINKSVERLNYIVKDLDMISELESGKIIIDSKPFNIVSVTQEVFDLLEIKAQKQNVKLSLAKDYPSIKVVGDEEKIQRVMVNLIINSIKHSNKNKTKVMVSFTKREQSVLIEVKDNGQGIIMEEIPRIFERFYRVDKSRSRKRGGAGLGLSIVKHILEAHDEKIQVKSQPNVSTIFSFSLKRALK